MSGIDMMIRVGGRECFIEKAEGRQRRTLSTDSRDYDGFSSGNVQAKATLINDLEICRTLLAEAIEGIRRDIKE